MIRPQKSPLWTTPPKRIIRHERRLLHPSPHIWVPKRIQPRMAVGFDNTSTNIGFTIKTTSTNIDTTITIGASATLATLILFPNATVSGIGTISATVNGNAMTAISGSAQTTSGGVSSLQAFGLLNPPSGSGNVTLAASATGAGAGTECYALMLTWTGTATSSLAAAVAATTNSGTVTPATVTAGAVASSSTMMFAGFDTDGTGYGSAGGSGEASLVDLGSDTALTNNSAASRATGNGSTPTLNYSINATDHWAAVILVISPPGSGVTAADSHLTMMGIT